MSFVSDYYDALVDRLEALFPPEQAWTRIAWPYNIEINSDMFLRKGWGLSLGQAQIQNGINCNYINHRTVRVVISRETMFTDSDATGISGVEKQLLEDLQLLITDFETNQMLNDGAGFAGYNGDSGIQGMRENESKAGYIFIEAEFTLRIVTAL